MIILTDMQYYMYNNTSFSSVHTCICMAMCGNYNDVDELMISVGWKDWTYFQSQLQSIPSPVCFSWNSRFSAVFFSFEGIILDSVTLGLREIKQFGKKHQETWLQFLYASLRQNVSSAVLSSYLLTTCTGWFPPPRPLEHFILLWLDWIVVFGAEIHQLFFFLIVLSKIWMSLDLCAEPSNGNSFFFF